MLTFRTMYGPLFRAKIIVFLKIKQQEKNCFSSEEGSIYYPKRQHNCTRFPMKTGDLQRIFNNIKNFNSFPANPYPIGFGTIPTGIRPKNPRELTGKMFQNSWFITSHLRIFRNFLRCEVMNREFWNIFPSSSHEFSGRIPFGIVPIPIGYNY